ncbi:hypothetical protein BH09BAC2_BH09BAC2_05820 [soil metagenome]
MIIFKGFTAMKNAFYLLLFICCIIKIAIMTAGCAQIMTPTGGPKDTIPPKLLSSTPANRTTNFKGDKITLNFNEYIDLDNVSQNLLVSPAPKKNPYVDYKLRTVTIKLKDTLMENTTYVINLGNSIKDLNEGNIYPDFTYVFSTGAVIDSLDLSGNVLMAETALPDSTLQVYLFKNAPDSAVQTRKPDYIARVTSRGTFRFTNLSAGNYKIYALKDADGSKTYNSSAEVFAFSDSLISVTSATSPVSLFAYVEEPLKPKVSAAIPGKPKQGSQKNDLTYNLTSSIIQSLLKPLTLEFSSPVKSFDKNKIRLTDTNYTVVAGATVLLDSTIKKINVNANWTEDMNYLLIINKDAVADSTGKTLIKTDTLKFRARKKSDYGSVRITFADLSSIKNPVLQFVVNNVVANSYPLTTEIWSAALFEPGDYELRILSDTNKNGIWDHGNYKLKKQPERVIAIPQHLTIKGNWDNEREIRL